MWVVLDIAIGLVTIFLLFSIVVSGLNEWAAHIFARRGDYLRLGLQRLINDEAVYRRVLHHPLIGSLYQERATQGKPPSYVDPKNFALAITDVLLARADTIKTGAAPSPQRLTVAAIRSALQSPALSASPAAVALRPIVDRAGDNLELALDGIQNWFNASMDRVSGWYKTRTRNMLFLIGLALAALCNVDAIEIAATLNRSPTLRTSLGDIATSAVKTGKVGDVNIGDLKSRPPTAAEWGSLQPVLVGLSENNAGGLPIGYACLGLAFTAATSESTSVSAPPANPAAAAAPSKTALSSCAQEFGRTLNEGSIGNGILKLLGWVLTALAGTLGAGYWFNLLTKAINVRSSGPKPPAPAPESGAKPS